MLKLINKICNIMFCRNLKLCAEVHSNWRKPRLEFEFPDLDSLNDKDGKKIIMGNREVNYSDILPQEQPPKHLSPSCNAHIKIDINVYNTRKDNYS